MTDPVFSSRAELEADLIAGARRELLRNIAIAPVVLLVRLPFALVFVSLRKVCEAAEWVGGFLPRFHVDYIRALRRHRRVTLAHVHLED